MPGLIPISGPKPTIATSPIVFAIQSEIARAIAEQLQAKLSANEKKAIEQRPTTDVTAFELYSRARTLMLTISLEGSYDKNLRQAIELLNSAVARDPSFHAAFCQLVFAHDQLYAIWDDHTLARLAAAEAALRRAAELRPNAAETHLARGSHLYRAFRDYTGALAELETARSGLPNDPRIFELTGYILRRQGRHEQAMRSLQQAIALDPRNAFMLGQLAGGYSILRRYAEEKAALKSALAIRPDAVGVAASLAYVDFAWRGDTTPLLQLINRLRTERPATLPEVADNWFLAALAERDWKAAEEALVALGDGLFWGDGPISLDRPFGEALLARAMHDEERAHQTFLAARKRQAQVVEEQKEFAAALCVLGLIDAALGSKEAALQEGHRAIELVPVDKNRVDHETLVAYFAMIAAWCGEKDLALQQLAAAVTTPGGGDVTSYGMLKRSPFWEPLRPDPRFEKIVASLAPKEPPK
jgi:tetratricopeptide (TPR) repeat protein